MKKAPEGKFKIADNKHEDLSPSSKWSEEENCHVRDAGLGGRKQELGAGVAILNCKCMAVARRVEQLAQQKQTMGRTTKTNMFFRVFCDSPCCKEEQRGHQLWCHEGSEHRGKCTMARLFLVLETNRRQ